MRTGRELSMTMAIPRLRLCAYGEESCTVCGPACVPVPGASVSYCGDGVVQSAEGEGCDDGNSDTEACAYGAASCTVCTADCQSGPGDGFIVETEPSTVPTAKTATTVTMPPKPAPMVLRPAASAPLAAPRVRARLPIVVMALWTQAKARPAMMATMTTPMAASTAKS